MSGPPAGAPSGHCSPPGADLIQTSRTVLTLDFDGTLAPIVADPADASANAASVQALADVGPHVEAVAIITGRPVAQVLDLGHFDRLDNLIIFGQYGAERWSSGTRTIEVAEPAPRLEEVRNHLPDWLADHDAQDAYIEDKGLALAVHTRRLDASVTDGLAAPLERLAAENRLRFEPGRQVLELRTPGIDKGNSLHAVVEETAANAVIFAGDDLGDVPAYDAVDELRARGLDGLLVCSASPEEDALVSRCDVVLDGPDGVCQWLCSLARCLQRADRSA